MADVNQPASTASRTMTDITKDWCLNMAEIEGGAEIGAGIPALAEAQAAEIEKLRTALMPFAAAADKADEKLERFERMGMKLPDDASPGWGITYGDLKRARSAFTGIAQ